MDKKKTVRNMILLIALMVFALWFALHKDARQVIQLLKNMNPIWAIVVLFMGILYYILAGVNLTWIARRYKKDYTYGEGITCAYSCALFNGITPVGCGQVAQSYVLKKQHIRMRDGISILWLDFIVFQSVILVYVLVLLILRFGYYYEVHSQWFLLVIAGFIVNSFVIFVLWTLSAFPNLYVMLSNKVVSIGAHLHIIKQPEKTKAAWEEQMTLFQEQILILKQDRMFVVKLALMQFLRMTLFYSIPFFAALALHEPMHFSQMLDVIAMSSFIHMLNALTPLPGDTGWSESAFVLIFSTMFVWNSASAIMLIWRFSTYHLILLIGTILFLRLKRNQDLLRFCKEDETPIASLSQEDYDIGTLEK